MGTFGETGQSGAYRALAADESRASKFTLGSAQVITRLVAYVSGGGATGSQVAKGVIYTDSSGPSALVAATQEVTVTSGQAAGWVTFAFAAPVSLAAADYWLGLHTGATGANIRLYNDTGSTAPKYVTDTYSDGPAATWSGGTNEPDPSDLSIYADWGTAHSAAVAFDAAPVLSATATHAVTLPTISAPVASSSNPAGDVTLTGTLTRTGVPTVAYEWEVDTANPPSSANADYQQIFTGYDDSGVARSVVASSLTAGTWYARVRATDGTTTCAWSTILTFYVFATVLLDPGSSVTRTILGVANKVYAKVEGTATVASATNTDAAYPPVYADSPREVLVLMKAGDATAAAAVAALHLGLRKVERYAISGLKIPIEDGLKIEVGGMVAVSHALSGVDGWFPVREVVHDFAADSSTFSVGDIDRPTDDEGLLLETAAAVAQLRKDVA